METTKMNYDSVKETEYNKVQDNKDQFKNKVENTLSNDATRELAEIFWLNKEQITKLTWIETAELADESEVNKTEAQLAKMFWKYEEIMQLSSKPISVAAVMNEFDEYERINN